MRLVGANSVVTPGTKSIVHQVESDEPLPEEEVVPFRGRAARGDYFSADRIDIIFSAKEICRFASAPSTHSTASLKRMVRYLRSRPRLVWKLSFQAASHLDVYSDTDWVGCPRTRR